ncbi:EpsG family protein [Methylocystis heyeri]|uniref:EpsG family protein n=1 Tax=Methylocystis heyeri TaxID=391905 RepID=A0A6B8KAA4_9HYPH|nr:EpsG family protein [Methylocystis heyeri]QGM45234.1 EpsG family protein [Methylocystis heyeri]
MWPYWAMFAFPSLAALAASGADGVPAFRPRPASTYFAWSLVWLAWTLLIGYRFQVGGDWQNYARFLGEVRGVEFWDVFQLIDPSYYALNWISLHMGWDIYGVNLIGAAIFAFGLVVFCQNQPWPWLALAVSVPYLVIVVGMGYSRQGIALGLEMLGLVALARKSTFKFVLCVAFAATFHRSAILLIPVAALAGSSNRLLTMAWVGATAVVLYYLLLEKSADNLVSTYVGGAVQSEGAAVRLLMNALPGAAFLRWRARFSFSAAEESLWKWFSIIALAQFGGFLIMPSASTALDRMALYMLPLQIVVFARLPYVFGAHELPGRGRYGVVASHDPTRPLPASKDAAALTAATLFYYGLVMAVWLNFASNVYAWVPYNFYPLVLAF